MNKSSGLGRRERGAYLLEVLIAIVVLSFGMLGMLGVMLNSMKLTTTSNYRTIASELSDRMADSIKASVPMSVIYGNASGSAAVGDCLSSTGCATSDMVATETSLWGEQLSNALPNGAGIVCQDSHATISGTPADWKCTAGTTDPFVVKVCWKEERVGLSSGYQCIYNRL